MLRILSILLIALVAMGCASQSTVATQPETQEVAQATPMEPPTETPAPLPTSTTPPTVTPIPPTNTPAPTNTPVPPTPTATFTNTPLPTETPVPATHTPAPTDTPIPPTSTPSAADHLGQAQILFEAGNLAEALAEVQLALQLQPDLAEAYKLLSQIYSQQGTLELSIQALEHYVQLVPANSDIPEVQAEIQRLRDKVASAQFGEVPAGKALFVFINYSGDQWNVDVGPHFLEVPPKPVDQDIFFKTQVMEPGDYTWMAVSPGGGKRAEDAQGNRAFNFTVAAGEIKIACVGGGSTQIGSIQDTWVGGGMALNRQDTSYTRVTLCGN